MLPEQPCNFVSDRYEIFDLGPFSPLAFATRTEQAYSQSIQYYVIYLRYQHADGTHATGNFGKHYATDLVSQTTTLAVSGYAEVLTKTFQQSTALIQAQLHIGQLRG